jgi:hypothetical protein
VIPWLIFGAVIVPLVVVAFVAARRRKVSGEGLTNADPEEQARVEQEFADAEAYEAEWRERNKAHAHDERLP